MVISMSVISKNVRKNQGTGIKFFEASQIWLDKQMSEQNTGNFLPYCQFHICTIMLAFLEKNWRFSVK